MNILELHYYLDSNSHSMNAIVKNKSEAELIKLFSEVLDILNIEIDLEFEAIKEGGIKQIIKFLKKKKNRKKLGKIALYLSAILSQILVIIISEHLKNDKELEKLNKEEKRLNIQKLKKELEKDSLDKEERSIIINNLIIEVSDTHKIQVFKSRFYKSILKEKKVYQLSVTELDESYFPISPERILSRENFEKQILSTEDLNPTTIENANIEIVSPVLKQGNIKWKGIYNGKNISFTLLDSDFKNEVQNKKYSFSNGTSIKCLLEIVNTIDENGEEIIKDAKVYDVLEVFDGQHSHTTKKAKHLKEMKNQTKLNFKD